MAYDQKFFRMYAAYLREPVVRRNHDKVFRMFRAFDTDSLVFADLGCGIGEFRKFGHYAKYVGVDHHDTGDIPDFVEADYTKPDLIEKLPFRPDAFVSLFSIEACLPASERYAIYSRMFSEIPGMKCALVSGFYYESKRHDATVSEKGGIVSHQTIEDLPDDDLPFDECRVLMRTPSRMFGQDVVEVWKFLTRRHD